MRNGFQSITSRRSTIMLQCHTQSSTMETLRSMELIRLADWAHQRLQDVLGYIQKMQRSCMRWLSKLENQISQCELSSKQQD